MTPTTARTTCEKSEVVCTGCCVSFAKPEKAKRSFLGFLKYHCPNCGKDIEYPLTTGYRVFYILFVLMVGVACAKAFASGGWAMPGLCFVASAIAVFIDASRRRQVRKAWEANRSLTWQGAPISTGATASSTKPIALVATVIAMAIGGILGKGIVKEIFENRDTVRFDQVLVEIAKEANATLPMQIDKETRLDTTFAGPGNRITYLFTMVNLSSGEVNPSEFCKAQKKELINGYRTNPSMAELRKRDVELTYQYRDKNANVFATIVVSPKDFAQLSTADSAANPDQVGKLVSPPILQGDNSPPTRDDLVEEPNSNPAQDNILQVPSILPIQTARINPPQFPTEFTNRAGLVYRRIKVQQAKPEGVVIACDNAKGIRCLEIIEFKDLSKEIQTYYGYDPNNPDAFQKRSLQLDQQARADWEADAPNRVASAKAEKLRRAKRNVFDEIDAEMNEEKEKKQFELVRIKAEKGDVFAQQQLGCALLLGRGVEEDHSEAVKWLRKAAEQNDAAAQNNLGFCYNNGKGVTKDEVQAVKWFRKAAEQNLVQAQSYLGICYVTGHGMARDPVEAVKWFRKAAEQNLAQAQYRLGCCYATGDGVAKDEEEGYKWFLLAAAQGNEDAKENMDVAESLLTRAQIAEGQRLARNFKPRKTAQLNGKENSNAQPTASGTGFFISPDGYLISNNHVVEGASQVRLVTSAGLISAKVVKVDAANDLALLKTEGRFAAVPVAASRGVKLGGTVVTVGFPNIGLQGFAPKLAKGEIASLSGAGDDARYFQISVPVQPGNSGGALVDERGNVVGVVSAKLNASAALALSGTLPENVNYAVKSSYLLSFLESVPDVASKLKEASTKEKKFEDVVKEAEQAAVLVLVY